MFELGEYYSARALMRHGPDDEHDERLSLKSKSIVTARA